MGLLGQVRGVQRRLTLSDKILEHLEEVVPWLSLYTLMWYLIFSIFPFPVPG